MKSIKALRKREEKEKEKEKGGKSEKKGKKTVQKSGQIHRFALYGTGGEPPFE
jgi:hypothetical protein